MDSLEAALEQSSARLDVWLASEQESPSRHLAKEEGLLEMVEAMARLPEDQRLALELEALEGAIGTRGLRADGQKPAAVAPGLCIGGSRGFREELSEET